MRSDAELISILNAKFMSNHYGLAQKTIDETDWIDIQVWDHYELCKKEKDVFDEVTKQTEWQIP